MTRKILVATDLSPASDCLIGCVRGLSVFDAGHIMLAHVNYVPDTPDLGSAADPQSNPDLLRQAGMLTKEGISVTPLLQRGYPPWELKALAERHKAEMIVVGSRGHGILRSHLGSVVFRLLHVATVPVLVAPMRVLGEGPACLISKAFEPFREVIVPTDCSEKGQIPIRSLPDLLRGEKIRVTLVNVLHREELARHGGEKAVDEHRGTAGKCLAENVDFLTRRGFDAGSEILEGRPVDEILYRASRDDVSLIAMTTQGKGFFREAMLGSASHEIVCHAEVPVLMFPAHEAKGSTEGG